MYSEWNRGAAIQKACTVPQHSPLLGRKAAGKRNNRRVCSEAEGEAAPAGDPLSRRLVHCQEDSCWKCFLTQSCQTRH